MAPVSTIAVYFLLFKLTCIRLPSCTLVTVFNKTLFNRLLLGIFTVFWLFLVKDTFVFLPLGKVCHLFAVGVISFPGCICCCSAWDIDNSDDSWDVGLGICYGTYCVVGVHN